MEMRILRIRLGVMILVILGTLPEFANSQVPPRQASDPIQSLLMEERFSDALVLAERRAQELRQTGAEGTTEYVEVLRKAGEAAFGLSNLGRRKSSFNRR